MNGIRPPPWPVVGYPSAALSLVALCLVGGMLFAGKTAHETMVVTRHRPAASVCLERYRCLSPAVYPAKAAVSSVRLNQVQTARDIQHCGKKGPGILLTVDDQTTLRRFRAWVDIFYREQVAAIFFVNGNFAHKHPDLVAYARQRGVFVGNHAYSHPQLTKLSDQQIADEIDRGVRSNLLRPPYGDYDARVARLAAGMGIRLCTWTVDTEDWKGKTGEQVLDEVLRAPRDSVVLMHLQHQGLSVLARMIQGLRAQGKELCSLPLGPVDEDVPYPFPCWPERAPELPAALLSRRS